MGLVHAGAAPSGRGAARRPGAAFWRARTRVPRRRQWDRDPVFWSFLALVVGAGLGLVGWAALSVLRQGQVHREPVLLAFVALLILAELRPLKWLRKLDGGEVTASWSFAAALLLMAHPALAVLAIALASAIADTVHRKGLVRVLFNASQTSLSLAAGAVVLTLTGTQALLLQNAPLAPLYLVWIAIAGGVVLLGNSAMTCLVLALHQHVSVTDMLRRNLLRNLSTDGMLLALAPIFVVVQQRSLVLVPLLLLTSFAVHRSVRMALDREHEALHDALTGLANRRSFDERLRGALAVAGNRSQALAVIMIDLDGFKDVNDRLGHQMGDQLLVAVGERLQSLARASDLVARLGGDEFAVLSTGAADREAVLAMAHRLRSAVSEPFDLDGVVVRIGGSFGIAFHPEDGRDAGALSEHADAAMYDAKRGGKGLLAYGSLPHRQESGTRKELMRDLEGAVDAGQLELHYQPVLDLATDRVVAVEALLRWRHPVRGLVPPNDFIPLAEQTDLIEPLTLWVLDRALADASAWRAAGVELGVAVNVSARNMTDFRFPDVVQGLLRRHRLPAALLDVEITENALNADPARVRNVLERLRGLGVSVSIDDFGTGYSSLSHLLDLPVDAVKIDRSFVIGMVEQREAELIVRSVIGLAEGLGLRTVSEGVETAAAQAAVTALGCHRMQGYHLSRPLPREELLAWLEDREPVRRHLEAVR